MTTANLVVGIKTEPARAALRELKAWMVSEMKGLTVGINDTAMINSMRASLSSAKFSISLDKNSIKDEVNRQLEEAFKKHYQVRINGVELTEEVKKAVTDGSGVVRPNVGETARLSPVPGVSGNIGELKAVMREILTPAVDELSKAAIAIGGTARKIGAGTTSTGGMQASSSFSRTNPETGERVGVKRRLDDAVGTLTGIQTDRVEDRKEFRENQNQIGLRAQMLAQRRAQARGEILRETEEYKQGLQAKTNAEQRETLNITGERATQFARLRAQARGDTLRETEEYRQGFQARTQAERQENLNALGERASQLVQRRAQARGDTLRETEEYRQGFRAKTQAERQEEINATGHRQEQIRQRLSDARREQQEMRNIYSSATLAAQDRYTPRGQMIVGAAAVQERFGPVKAAKFINNDEVMSAIPLVEKFNRVTGESAIAVANHRKRTEETTAAHKQLNTALNEGHSAARGLAGSMGSLWLTYGSLIPLAAGAAIGASLRSVFTIGKDVEYQLKFVQLLSDNTIVSIKEFGNAVRGSMTLPTQAAEGMRALAQNGLSVQQSLQALPDILRLATAGEMTLSEAALGATGVMAAFNLQVSDLGRVGDVFAKAAAISNTSVSGMVEAMKKASTVSDLYHVSLEETAASLAVLAKRNITGTAAGTAFTNMMTELATPQKKARDAMASVHLELYTGSKQLKSYGDLLTELRDKTILLNEKGKLEFLSDLFGERGGKAVNALVSDFELYSQTLDEVKNKSKDFAKTVTEGLGETTSGKLKALTSEFQLTTIEAFNNSSSSVNHFVDTLRIAASSTGFKTTLDWLISSVSSLTTFLVDHAKVIGITVAVWAGFKVINSLLLTLPLVKAGFTALAGQVVVAESAVLAFGAASRLALGAMTGGLSLVVTLGIEYLLMGNKTDSATAAQKRFEDQLTLQGQTLDVERERLAKSNAMLARRVDLLKQGLTAGKVDKTIADEDAASSQKTFQTGVSSAVNDAKAAKQKLDDFNAKALKNPPQQGAEMIMFSKERNALQAEYNSRQKVVADANRRMVESERDRANKNIETEASEAARRLTLANEFNDKLAEIRRKKPDIKVQPIDTKAALQGDKESFDRMLAEKNEQKNSQLNTYVRPDPASDRKAQAAARSEDLARSRGLQSELDQQDKDQQQKFRNRKALEQARYDPNLYGPYILAALAEQRQIDETYEAIKRELGAVRQLEAAKNSPNFNKADKINIQTLIEKRQDELARLKIQLDFETQLGSIQKENRERTLRSNKDTKYEKLDVQADSNITKMRESYSNKVIDKSVAAGNESALQAMLVYSQAIAEQEQKVLVANESLVNVRAHINELSPKALDAAIMQQSVEETTLVTLKAQASAKAEVARKAGTQEFEKSQTAEYGWGKFWNEYRNNAESNATAVYDAMKKTTTGMTDMMSTFATTGKLHFKSFAASVAAEAAKMLMNRAIMQFVGLALGSFGGGSIAGGVNGSAGSGFGAFYAAEGGVVGNFGSVPLKKFASGGIARSPMMSVFGEGKLAEAYVPLKDGKTIPVTLKGEHAYVPLPDGRSIPVTLKDEQLKVSSSNISLKANGGIVSGLGDMPLKKFASGGIARSPMLSLFGEGRQPEAYVPLPDGRSIPVTVKGGGGGEGGNTSVQIHVNVASDGNTQVNSDSSGKKAEQLGSLLSDQALRVIEEQKRPGGLLYGPSYV